ncbi:MAG TPA: class I SAM-dependent methyltransferase [Aggregatilineales bacterium]|nr:class I SAM-dependent methyltransferase [Aggregatilineales bacterium]
MTQLEYVPCDLCGAIDAAPYLKVHDQIYHLPGEFQLVKCGYCELIYLNPRPDSASIGAFYPDLDYHAFRPSSGFKADLLKRRRESEARSLVASLPAHPRILEIGCATGELLVTLRTMGAQVAGVEPNAAAVQVARDRHALDVQQGTLDEATFEPGQFDLVLMKYALEHVHSPLATLRRIRDLLKPGGQVVLWVPNAASLDSALFGKNWRGLDAPRHLYIFTPKTMRRLIQTAQLRLTKLSYDPMPNDFAGSVEFWLLDHAISPMLARALGVNNPAALVAWLPISTLAALAHRSGRIRVTATRD